MGCRGVEWSISSAGVAHARGAALPYRHNAIAFVVLVLDPVCVFDRPRAQLGVNIWSWRSVSFVCRGGVES